MKCEECLQLIDLYFDWELGPREAAAVAAHLDGCEQCSLAHQSLREEQSLYLRYGCDATESPSFWDEVLSRAESGGVYAPDTLASRLRRRLVGALPALSAPRFSPTVTAAMLLAAVVLTAAVMIYVRPRDNGPGPVSEVRHGGDKDKAASPPEGADDIARNAESGAAPAGHVGGGESGRLTVEENPGGPGRGRQGAKTTGAGAAKADKRVLTPTRPEGDPERLIREAERKYLAAIAALSRDVGRRRPQVDLETMARFERSLAVVDKAIAETRAAARRHPHDPVVVQYMMTAYAKKVDLLREIAQD